MTWWSRYIGVPYEQMHCWALVRTVYADRLGIDLPEYGEIEAGNLVAVSRAIGHERANGPWLPAPNPVALDVCLMRGRSAIWHVGVMTDHRHLLHTERSSGVVRVRADDFKMRGRVVGFWRHTG
jgi:cell wall-associated NlpC family hydrolase